VHTPVTLVELVKLGTCFTSIAIANNKLTTVNDFVEEQKQSKLKRLLHVDLQSYTRFEAMLCGIQTVL